MQKSEKVGLEYFGIHPGFFYGLINLRNLRIVL
jgi:hypothetical protein